MFDPVNKIESKKIDLADWREKKRADLKTYRTKQASEIILFAIARCPELQPYLLLKGGTLMGVAYDSPRQTLDLDFTMTKRPMDTDKNIVKGLLDKSLKLAAADLGYAGLNLAVQRNKWKPKETSPIEDSFPALELTVGYANQGTKEHQRLLLGKATTVVQIDISFNESDSRIQILELDERFKLLAYSWIELIAEKTRALLQQLHMDREKSRRQDIYDIDRLITNIDIRSAQKSELLLAIMQKCQSRNIVPTSVSFNDPKLKDISGREWNDLLLELDEIPNFDECFARVAGFYKSLPWSELVKPKTNV